MKARRCARVGHRRVLVVTGAGAVLLGLSTISFADVSAYRPGPQQLRIGGQSASVLAPDADLALPPLPSPTSSPATTSASGGAANTAPSPEESAAPPAVTAEQPASPAGSPTPAGAPAGPASAGPSEPAAPEPSAPGAQAPDADPDPSREPSGPAADPVTGPNDLNRLCAPASPGPPAVPSESPQPEDPLVAGSDTGAPVSSSLWPGTALVVATATRLEPASADSAAMAVLAIAGGENPIELSVPVIACPGSSLLALANLPPEVAAAAAGRAVALYVLSSDDVVMAEAAWPAQAQCSSSEPGADVSMPVLPACAGAAAFDRPIAAESIPGTQWVFAAS